MKGKVLEQNMKGGRSTLYSLHKTARVEFRFYHGTMSRCQGLTSKLQISWWDPGVAAPEVSANWMSHTEGGEERRLRGPRSAGRQTNHQHHRSGKFNKRGQHGPGREIKCKITFLLQIQKIFNSWINYDFLVPRFCFASVFISEPSWCFPFSTGI